MRLKVTRMSRLVIAVVTGIAALATMGNTVASAASPDTGDVVVNPASGALTGNMSWQLSTAAPSADGVGIQLYSDCQPGAFCGWDGQNGSGHGIIFPNYGCGYDVNIGLQGLGDMIESIWNRSPYTVGLFDWRGYWHLLWYSAPGNWGNLPSYAQNRTDMVRFYCGGSPGVVSH